MLRVPNSVRADVNTKYSKANQQHRSVCFDRVDTAAAVEDKVVYVGALSRGRAQALRGRR